MHSSLAPLTRLTMRFFCGLLVLFGCCLRAAAEDDPLRTLHSGHPRLLMDAAGFRALRSAADHDPLRKTLHEHIRRAAEQLLKEPPIAHVLVGPRMLDQSRRALAHVTTCAMAYQLTCDRRFAAHAKSVMLLVASFPDWNPSHFLDVAEMATAVALGYDWLYDDLSAEERVALKRALLEKALAFAGPAYARKDVNRESFPFVGSNLRNNWNQVCNGGFVLAALAIADEEPDLARSVIAGVRETLPYAMEAYEPDGAYPEGPVYWGYGTRYNILILAALESALGTDFGLGRGAFQHTALYRHQVESPTGLSFNYADGRPTLGADSGLTWLSQRFHQPAVEAHSRELLEQALKLPPVVYDRFLATHALWFPRKLDVTQALPLDVHFRGPSEIVILRGAWNDPRALWIGLKAGSNRVNHGHLDLGSFVLDADGERWAHDLGPDDYDLPGYWESATIESARWQLYRLNNLSHNSLRPDGTLQSPDAAATMTKFGSTPARAFAVADLTSAFPHEARRWRRGVALLDRSRVLVQDEIETLKPATTLTWQMLTSAQIVLDGRTAILTQNGRTLRAEILTPQSGRFVTRPATPPTAAENQNRGITSLMAEFRPPAAAVDASTRIAILLTPEGDRWSPRPTPLVIALDEWQ